MNLSTRGGNLLEEWDFERRGPMRIGLSGFNSPTGLGYQNRDLVDKLSISSWLVVEHPTKSTLPPPDAIPTTATPISADDNVVSCWLESIDCLLFYEQPLISGLAQQARRMGIAVVCIPNWEWLNPEAQWIGDVDCFVCPNRHTFDLLSGWKRARNAKWKLVHVPAPVDTSHFRASVRERCESFLFVNGQGGCTPYFSGLIRHRKGPPRKGLDVVLRAAKLVPEIPVYIRSQVELPARTPGNVTLLPPVRDNNDLFESGDVAIQPSYFEGTGLQMIETLASGVPLIATDAPPMNELPLLGAIRCTQRIGKVGGNPIPVNIPDAKDLARIMRQIVGTDLAEASRSARTYVEEHHSWSAALDLMNGILQQTKTPSSDANCRLEENETRGDRC